MQFLWIPVACLATQTVNVTILKNLENLLKTVFSYISTLQPNYYLTCPCIIYLFILVIIIIIS